MHARVRISVYLDLIESTRVHIFLASRGRDIKRETTEKKTSSFGLKQVIGVRALIPFFFAPFCLCLATWACLTGRPPSVGAWVACCQRVEKKHGQWALYKHSWCGYYGQQCTQWWIMRSYRA